MPNPPSNAALEEAWRAVALQENNWQQTPIEAAAARELHELMITRVEQQIVDAQMLESSPQIRAIRPISSSESQETVDVAIRGAGGPPINQWWGIGGSGGSNHNDSGLDAMSHVMNNWATDLYDTEYDIPVLNEASDSMTNHVRYAQLTYCNEDGYPDGYDSWRQYHQYLTTRLVSATQDRYRIDYEARLRECEDVINGLASWRREEYRWFFSWMGPMDYTDATSYGSDGSAPEWFNDWNIYLEHINRNPNHWTRRDDRIREANEVIARSYIEFNTRNHLYTWSWMMPTRPVTSKSLLTVVKYIKKNRKTLKETSRCWSWLQTCKLHYFRKNRERTELPTGAMLLTTGGMLAQRFIDGVNRYINDPNFVIVTYQQPNGSHAYLFKKDLVVYHTNLDLHDFFSLKKDFTQTYITKVKAAQYVKSKIATIVDDKHYSNSCFLNVWQTPQDLVLIKEIADRNKHDQCVSCKTIWYKEKIKFSPALDERVCPTCHSKENAEHTLDTVHSGYHSHRGEWKFFIRRKNGEQTLPMGIEIEMATRNSSMPMASLAMTMAQAQKDFNKEWHEVYFERDGSIGDNGLECVSNPMTLDFAKEYWEKMLPVFRAKCIGWRTKAVRNTDAASYGIHLTVHRKYFSNLQLARTVKFFNDSDNHEFLKAIAQRDYLYGNEGWANKSKPSLIECNIMKEPSGRIHQSRGKYSPVNVKTINLIEFRMFASTLNQESFMKNYEFLDSFWHWVKETSYSTDWKQYIQWLAVQKQTVRRWPNLVAYLYRDHFYVKNSYTTAYKVDNKILPVFKKLCLNKILIQPNTTVTEVITMDTDSCA